MSADLAKQIVKFLSPMDTAGFEALDKNLTPPSKLPESCRGKDMNRYHDILPTPETMVKVSGDPNRPATEYINANFVRDISGRREKYIAAQGPLEGTVATFVRMLWERKVPAVVMATKLVEGDKPKCAAYFPEGEQRSITAGPIQVERTNVQQHSGYVRSDLVLRWGPDTRTVTHFWFTAWPDHGVPVDPKGEIYTREVVLMLQRLRELLAAAPASAGPVVVHCSAGIGRSGAIIAIDMALDAVEAGQYADMLAITAAMRRDRMAMIQHTIQYKFACMAAAQHIFTLLTRGQLQVPAAPLPRAGAARPSSTVPPAASSAAAQGERLVTLKAFVPAEAVPGVIAFKAGEPVVVLEKTEKWWKARVGSAEGWVQPEFIGPDPNTPTLRAATGGPSNGNTASRRPSAAPAPAPVAAAGKAEPSFEEIMDMVLDMENNGGDKSRAAAAADPDVWADGAAMSKAVLASRRTSSAVVSAPTVAPAEPTVPVVPGAYYSDLQPWTYVTADGTVGTLGNKNPSFTVPVLPAGRLRAPHEVVWPAIVGFDQVWRHAIFGTRLALERPTGEQAESQRRMSTAQAMV